MFLYQLLEQGGPVMYVLLAGSTLKAYTVVDWADAGISRPIMPCT
ncbi:MAG: hypothetical protein ABGX83_02265 [Nitrospira sp.]